MIFRTLLLFFCVLPAWLAWPTWAQTQETIYLNDGDLEIPITRFESFEEQAPILLWLPSSRGTSSKQNMTASALGDLDIETWIVDLHLAYFLDPGRKSVDQFNPEDIAQLINEAAKRTSKKVYLIATDRVAKPALQAIALVQQRAQKNNAALEIGGLILFHPFLTRPTTEPGTKAEFLPVAKNSTIPIYYIQPSISTRQWHSQEAVSMLQANNSAVFFHALPGVAAGYHLRPDEDMSELDLAQRAKLPQDIKSAIKLLAIQPEPPAPESTETQTVKSPTRTYGLNRLNNRNAQPLSLLNINAEKTLIDYAKYPISIISFWASWCEPCIRELPSLRRLHDDYHDKGVRIITVNVGESLDDIQKAIKTFQMDDYINLLDPQGDAMKKWNVYGFPTNFLVDNNGGLPYASFGGVEWDEPAVREIFDDIIKTQ